MLGPEIDELYEADIARRKYDADKEAFITMKKMERLQHEAHMKWRKETFPAWFNHIDLHTPFGVSLELTAKYLPAVMDD